MIEVTVTINFRGRKYQTNVIVEKGTPKKQILRMANEQIRRQWEI